MDWGEGKLRVATFEVLSCAGRDAARWQSYFDQLGDYRDVMFTPAYARVQESIGQGPCFAAVYQWQDFFILQPFMLKGQEMVSFYGGGGPISNLMDGASPRLWLWFEREFVQWRKEHKINGEYVRLHPLFEKGQRRMLRESGLRVEHLREAVLVSIDHDDDTLLKSFSRNRQRGVKDVPQCGVEPFHDTEVFSGLYWKSSQRLQTQPSWRYPDLTWGTYQWELSDEFATYFVTRDEHASPIGALLVLHGYGKAYAHFLGGEGNDRLYYESMKYCRDIGCKTYFLGGGTTSAPDDSLLMYKSGFSQMRVPVYFYRREFKEPLDADSSEAFSKELDVGSASGNGPELSQSSH